MRRTAIKAEGWANSCGPGHDYSSIGGGKDNPLNAYRSMKAFVPVLTPNRARVTENIDEFQYDYEEGKEEGTAVNIASELPVTLKDYYQEFDNTVLCGTTFADQSIYHPGSDSGTGANASPSKSKNRKRFSGSKGLTRANSYSDANVLAMYSPVPSLSPLKSHNITVNQTLNFNQNQSAIESPDKNARHPSDGDPSAEHSKLQSDFALDRESGLNHAEVSSFYYSDNHENPFNKSGMTGIDDGLSPKKKSATINAKTISTAADRYKLAYQSLKEKDILNVNNLEVSTLNRDAAGAQKRWKEFIHKTSHNIYAGTKYEQEMEEFGNDPKHHYSATASFRNDDKDEWDRLPIEDNVDEYLVRNCLHSCLVLCLCASCVY